MTYAGSIQQYMTWMPHAVDTGQSIAGALGRMQMLSVGHLPVMERGRVVGMLAERELTRVSTVAGFDAQLVPVADVMRPDVYCVGLDAPLVDTVRDMAQRHSDCCAVVEGDRLVGILTSTDVLAALARVLGGEQAARACTRPSEVRARILDEHTMLRAIFIELDRLADQASEGPDEQVESALRERSRELCLTLGRHIELENRILAPALRQTDGFGDVRADQLLAEHATQTRALADLLERIDSMTVPQLATAVHELISALRADMFHEERALLSDELLRDDVVDVSPGG
jgi:CBS domain-containing protein/iron-sulfur cluster repair protein YtfE (RIC family)